MHIAEQELVCSGNIEVLLWKGLDIESIVEGAVKDNIRLQDFFPLWVCIFRGRKGDFGDIY